MRVCSTIAFQLSPVCLPVSALAYRLRVPRIVYTYKARDARQGADGLVTAGRSRCLVGQERASIGRMRSFPSGWRGCRWNRELDGLSPRTGERSRRSGNAALPPILDSKEVTMNGCLLGRLLILSIAVVFTVSTPYAIAQSVREGRTAQDRRYIAGGIGLDESEQMKAMARDFPLSITVAAKSGAYLPRLRTSTQDASGTRVLDTQLDRPFLTGRSSPREGTA